MDPHPPPPAVIHLVFHIRTDPSFSTPTPPPPAVIHSYGFRTRCDSWCWWEDRWVSRRVPAFKHRLRHGRSQIPSSHAVPPFSPLPPTPLMPGPHPHAPSTGDGEPRSTGPLGFPTVFFHGALRPPKPYGSTPPVPGLNDSQICWSLWCPQISLAAI